ncbi:VanZ family protein [Lachnoclostridium phytofermentans]|uniref:VanZ family protein n=1 Tax=Lachnoclostridium phytofermentans TaxID=66219 RepID=UPI000B0AED5C|nr:VanZ family protein [Lachnoclostridium phytofermentans]
MKCNLTTGKRALVWILFLGYLACLSYFLFFSERYGRTDTSNGYRYNLVLFREIKRFFIYRREVGLEGFLVNMVGNVAAFMPFGFCLPMISLKRRGFFSVLFWSFGLTLTIETIQLLYQIGSFDVDDLLLNTIGGVLGYICYRIMLAIYTVYKVRKSSHHKYRME